MRPSTKMIFALAAFSTVLIGPAFAQRQQKAHQAPHRQQSYTADGFTQTILQELVNGLTYGSGYGGNYGTIPDFQSGSEKN